MIFCRYGLNSKAALRILSSSVTAILFEILVND